MIETRTRTQYRIVCNNCTRPLGNVWVSEINNTRFEYFSDWVIREPDTAMCIYCGRAKKEAEKMLFKEDVK